MIKTYKMNKILIVSRTRMKENRVCVGGIDLTQNCPIRLLDPNGYHEDENICPYEIGDIWNCSYVRNPRRPAPHLEDSNVISRTLVQKHACTTKDDFVNELTNHGVKIFNGNLNDCFDGCLATDGRKYYVSQNTIPQYSTCFWINDKVLRRNDFPKSDGGTKKQLAYMDGSSPWGRSIAYVGLGNTPQLVPTGSLVRLSLANWWSKDNNTPKRCYLQVSWVY